MSCSYWFPSKKQFFKYLQALSQFFLSIDVGDHDILLEKFHLAPMGGISWQVVEFTGKRGLNANSLSGPFKIENINERPDTILKTYWVFSNIIYFHFSPTLRFAAVILQNTGTTLPQLQIKTIWSFLSDFKYNIIFMYS